MRQALLAIGAAALLAGCASTDISRFNPPPVLVKHQECADSSECVLVQRECDDCDCGTPVNRIYEMEISKEKEKRCANYKGAVCDIWCPTTKSKCVDGLCTEE